MAGRTEARIFASIWDDPDFLALEPGAQRLYMFLLSQKDLSYCGVLPLRPARWARKAAGLTLDDVERELKALEGTAYPTANPDPESARTPLLVIDRDTGEVLVRSLMRRDGIWKQPNLFKLAIEAAEQVDSLRICGCLLAELRRLPLTETGSAQVKTLVGEFIAGLEKGEPYPTPYPLPDPADYPPDDPSGNGAAKDYARAQGSGGSVVDPGISPDPLFPVAPKPFLPAQERKRGTRLPDDFALTDEMRAWAAEKTPHVDAEWEFDQFCDWWRSKAGRDGAKLDWDATWRNWMRKAEDRQRPRDRQRASPREQAQAEQRQRQMQRAIAKEEAG